MGERAPSQSPLAPPAPRLSTPQPNDRHLAYDILWSEAAEHLPAPLPSVAEIEAAYGTPRHTPGMRVDSVPTVSFGRHYFVKFGVFIKPIEAEHMRFVARHCSEIGIPRVYAVYQHPLERGLFKTYIVMEFIEGQTLDALWGRLDAEERDNIVLQLKDSFKSLRELPSPGYFGSVCHSAMTDPMFQSSERDPRESGPFNTEQELLDGIIKRYIEDCGPSMHNKAEYYRRILPRVLHGDGKAVFTHGNFRRKYIMVQPDGKVVMLRWQWSGWYPSYWEYAACNMGGMDWEDDWHRYLAEILEEFPNQGSWLSTLRMEMLC